MKLIIRALEWTGFILILWLCIVFMIDPTIVHFIIPLLLLFGMWNLTRISNNEKY